MIKLFAWARRRRRNYVVDLTPFLRAFEQQLEQNEQKRSQARAKTKHKSLFGSATPRVIHDDYFEDDDCEPRAVVPQNHLGELSLKFDASQIGRGTGFLINVPLHAIATGAVTKKGGDVQFETFDFGFREKTPRWPHVGYVFKIPRSAVSIQDGSGLSGCADQYLIIPNHAGLTAFLKQSEQLKELLESLKL